jgi:two-component system sensor histidine kinase YesM
LAIVALFWQGERMGKMNIRNLFKSSKIKTKLIVIFAIVVVYTFFVVIYFGYGSYRGLMIKKSLNYSLKNEQGLTMLLKEKVDNLNNFTRVILYDDKIYSFSRQIILSEEDPFFRYKLQLDVEDYLRSILYTKDELLSVAFKFTDIKTSYISSRIYTMNPDIQADLPTLYAKGKQGRGKPVWVVMKKDGKLNIYVAKMVYNMNTLREIGLYVFKVNPDSIFNVLKDLSANTQNNMYIMDSFGNMLYEYKYFNPKQADFNKKIFQIKDSGDYIKLRNGLDDIYVHTSMINSEAFKLITCVSSQSILKEVNDLSKFLFFLVLLIVPILLVLINYFQRDLIKPLNLLVAKMKRVEKGEMGTTIEIVRGDEFGYVFKTFNKMSSQIKVLIDSVYKEQIALKEEEIRALQAQINPHFLYNTLEAINWKARIHKVPDISDMVAALSYIMEANMNRNNEKLVTLEKEIEYIHNYRFIIIKRFNEKFKFIINVPKEVMNYKVPKLIILPVVENSVYHGLEMKRGEGVIELSINTNEDKLIISISDNGQGIEEEKLQKIKGFLDIDVDDLEEHDKQTITNIGLFNVNKRIRLLYGNQYGLEVISTYGEGTRVNIVMPLIV